MRKRLVKIVGFSVLTWLLCTGTVLAQKGEVTVNQDAEIDQLLQLKKEINRTESKFKIQIFNGSRSDAEKARLDFRRAFPDLSTSMHYETPNYKIWIGAFNSRLEADRALLRVKQKFSSAFIFTPKIEKKEF